MVFGKKLKASSVIILPGVVKKLKKSKMKMKSASRASKPIDLKPPQSP
jgi:hypothetical protein